MERFQKGNNFMNAQVAPKKSIGEMIGAFLMILILGLPVFFIGLAVGFLQNKGKETFESSDI